MNSPPNSKIISVSVLALISSFSFACQPFIPISESIKSLIHFRNKQHNQNVMSYSDEKELMRKQKQLMHSISITDPHLITITQFEDSIFIFYTLNTFPAFTSYYATIANALKKLHKVKGFVGLMKTVLTNLHNANNFAGFFYEVEKGLDIYQTCTHEQLIEFQQIVTIPNSDCTREFDIVTTERIIECKNINWKKQKLKRQFLAQKRAINKLNRKNKTHFIYEVCSKKSIPDSWQEWFKQNNIKFSSDESN